MKVAMTFNFTEEERRQIAWDREGSDFKAPATHQMIRDWLFGLVGNGLMGIADRQDEELEYQRRYGDG
jgi:hypothetical protein